MNEDLITALLEQGEGATIDYKEEPYVLSREETARGGKKLDPIYFERKKSELLKDILAMANAFREHDSHILVGVRERPGQSAEAIGIDRDAIHNEADIQQFVSTHVEKPIVFEYKYVQYRGQTIAVLRIPLEQLAARPFLSRNDYGNVKKGVTYIRRGSHTDIAASDTLRAMFAPKNAAPTFVPPQVRLLDRDRNRTQHLLIPFRRMRFPDPQSLPDFTDQRGWLGKKFGSRVNSDYWREFAACASISLNSAWIDLEIINTSDVYLTECTVQIVVTTLNGRPAPAHNYMPREPTRYGEQQRWRKDYADFLDSQKRPAGDWKTKELSGRSLRPGDKSGFNNRLLLYFGEHEHLNVQYKVLAKELSKPAEGMLVASISGTFDDWTFEQLKSYASSGQLERTPRHVVTSP